MSEETVLENTPAASVPQPLLGPYGDLPVACAIFQVDIDEAAGKATDCRYLYVNQEFRNVTRRLTTELVGHSHLAIGEINAEKWLALCYRAVVGRETINAVEYDPLVRSWISYNLAPAQVEGCCVYAFVPVDNRPLGQQLESVKTRTYRFVSEMLSTLTGEQSYEAAMNGMLEMMSTIIHTDRMDVFECSGEKTQITFERCNEGVPSLVGAVFDLSRDAMKRWFRNVAKDPVVLVPDARILERFSKPLYDWCQASNIRSLMAAPFFIDGEIVGFLGAYNYKIDETVDLNHLFKAVSSFIGARIEIHRLIDNLAWAGEHDVLTKLLNRRGSQQVIGRLFSEQPDGPFAMVLFDLDDFKRINDLYGHNAGDAALRYLAKLLERELPEGSVLSRNGGDEFLVMLTGEGARNADSLIERLSKINLEFEYEGESHPITMSIGYACYPEQASTIQELVSKADTALYDVKLAGKNDFGKYTPVAEKHSRSQLGFTIRDIIDSIPYPMIMHEAGGESAILFATAEMARFIGLESMYDLMRFSNGAFSSLLHPDDRERVLGEMANMASRIDDEGGKVETKLEMRLLTKAGDYRAAHSHLCLVDIEDSGKVFYTLFR